MAVSRLRCDGEVTVSVVQTMLETWMDIRASRDLLRLTSQLETIRWSHNAKIMDLVGYYDLFKLIMEASATAKVPLKPPYFKIIQM